MAFKLEEYKNPSGVPVIYWKVGGVNINPIHKTVDISMVGYYSEETRAEELEPVGQPFKVRCTNVEHYETYFGLEAMNIAENNIFKCAYEFAKFKEPMFENAICC